MSKLLNKSLRFLIAFTLLLTFGFSNIHSFAQENGRVTIYLYKNEHNLTEVLAGKELKLWKITDSTYLDRLSTTAEEDVKKAISEDFKDKTIEDLDKDYDSRVTDKSNDAGSLIVDNLEKGIYYAREINVSGDYEVAPFVIIMPHESSWSYDIRAKGESRTVPPQPEQDKTVTLSKVDQNKTPLEHVGFRLIQRTANGEVEIPLTDYEYDKDGKSTVLYTDFNGEIIVKGLPEGEYIFREVEPLPGYEVDNSDNVISISTEELYHLEVVNKKTNKGRQVFLKISNDERPIFLEGAIFKVYTKNKNGYEAVIKDGMEYEVTSKKNGEFTVEDLDFGTYYLWEVKAPEGYVQLSEGIEFVLDENTKADEVIVIKNETYKEKIKKKIPKTGDIKFFVLVIGGFIIFLLGYFISKEKIN